MSPLALQPAFLLLDLLLLVGLRRRPALALPLSSHVILFLSVSWLGLDRWNWQMFGVMQLACWSLFVHGPLLLGALGLGRRSWRAPSWSLAALLMAVGLDAFVVEPRWLEVTTVQIVADGLAEPVRIALVADLQTDRPGAFEARALARVAAAEPDLVLFAGDYVQVQDRDQLRVEQGKLRDILLQAGLNPPLGAYAVRGDIDRDGWEASFAGTGIQALLASTTLDLGPLVLTGLDQGDSRSERPPVPPSPKYQVVFGHAPDFSLARPAAGLLLAGHTHGGQVQLPFIGPLVTLTEVPRDQAAGHTRLDWGADLIVSRGVGMERKFAPRLRFLCRPEVVIIELVPGGGAPQADRGL